MFGGGMRQVGVIAAAGLVALRKGPGRLGEDHAHARLLAEAVAELPGVELDPARVVTNILVFRVTSDGLAEAFLARAREHGVLASPVSRDEVRMVTHKDVSQAGIDLVIARLRQALLRRRRSGLDALRATRSISTRAARGRPATWTVVRAGRWSPMASA